MRAKAKYAVIYRHRKEYPILVMCKFFSVSRSGYYSFVKRMNRPEKDASLAETIRQQQSKCFHTYGYRRMWQWLKESEGIYHNPTTILRIMQTVNLVLDTIRQAIRREKKKAAAELQLHSDQGFQYTSQAYFKLTQQYGITPSMSRRGNPYDNAMAENFFSILKTECIYRHKPATFSEANEMIDRYIHFYNHERIQSKTGVAPLTLRHSC